MKDKNGCEFNVGDMVKVIDGSQSINLNTLEHDYLGLYKHDFEVFKRAPGPCFMRLGGCGREGHDIIIRDTKTGELHLHSSPLVVISKRKVEEMTLAEVCEELGREIKIRK